MESDQPDLNQAKSGTPAGGCRYAYAPDERLLASSAPLLSIRHEHEQDNAAVRHVHVAAFPTSSEADLVCRLHAGGKSEVSLVAETEDLIIGHIVFSRAAFDPPPSTLIKYAPEYSGLPHTTRRHLRA